MYRLECLTLIEATLSDHMMDQWGEDYKQLLQVREDIHDTDILHRVMFLFRLFKRPNGCYIEWKTTEMFKSRYISVYEISFRCPNRQV